MFEQLSIKQSEILIAKENRWEGGENQIIFNLIFHSPAVPHILPKHFNPAAKSSFPARARKFYVEDQIQMKCNWS